MDTPINSIFRFQRDNPANGQNAWKRFTEIFSGGFPTHFSRDIGVKSRFNMRALDSADSGLNYIHHQKRYFSIRAKIFSFSVTYGKHLATQNPT
ncbi:hypothetical protein [Diaphorobacter aerolatus]|uniref:Uncharacterized protein n=1 Tax=Diaphorobacter aerolatus TaxID=1288495 RepID=A0A7H0GH63_9BURK|nr:hypothetical protein [Diaphorobacter aerolatus]QNP47629.1 hypothetical protein H9K75_15585 [Diaphorobacter aerolatus]